MLEDLGFIKVERYKESTVLFNNFTILDFYTRLIDNFKNTSINELDEFEKYVGIENAKLDDYYLYPYWNGVKYDNIIKS